MRSSARRGARSSVATSCTSPPAINDATESHRIHESIRLALIATRLKATGLELARRSKRTHAGDAPERRHRRTGRRADLAPWLQPLAAVHLRTAAVHGRHVRRRRRSWRRPIEEKSSRVVEVLLAAVSPLELMWGKLLASARHRHCCVMALYVRARASPGCRSSQMLGLLDPSLDRRAVRVLSPHLSDVRRADARRWAQQ